MKKRLVIWGLYFLFMFIILSFVSAECIDSDGGKDYFVAGIVTYDGETFSDYCEEFAEGRLIEYYCSGGVVDSESYGECSEGCAEGACISPPEETCIDECPTPELRQCFGNGFKICRDYYDSDPCLEWSSTMIYCSSGEECSEGICIPSTSSCVQVKYSCETNDDCCSGLICGNNLCCSPIGQECYSNSECCSGFLCINNLCTEPFICKTEGTTCVYSSECCSGLMCESYAGGSNTCISRCQSSGESCTSYDDCCLGLTCQNGLCCKTSFGESCGTNDDCCSPLICGNWEGSKTCIYDSFSNIISSTTPEAKQASSPTLSSQDAVNYNTELKTSQIKSITLETDESERLIYSVSGTKEGKLFAIIPISTEVEQKIDANTGEIISTEKPWWSFIASGI